MKTSTVIPKRFLTLGIHHIDTTKQPTFPTRELKAPMLWHHDKSLGMLLLDFEAVEGYQCEEQRYGGRIRGYDFFEKIKNSTGFWNGCVLDYLIENPKLIPDEWKGLHMPFWGSIFKDEDGELYVKFLYFNSSAGVEKWEVHTLWLGYCLFEKYVSPRRLAA